MSRDILHFKARKLVFYPSIICVLYVCVGVQILCTSLHSSQGINNSFPEELDKAMSGWFVYGFRVGHNNPFCIKHSFLIFSLHAGGLYEHRGDGIESGQGMQSRVLSPLVTCQRKSKNRENTYYTFPWYCPSIHFCRQRSFIHTYLGSARLLCVSLKFSFSNSLEAFLAFVFVPAFCRCFQSSRSVSSLQLFHWFLPCGFLCFVFVFSPFR